jgi:hypothetical protein
LASRPCKRAESHGKGSGLKRLAAGDLAFKLSAIAAAAPNRKDPPTIKLRVTIDNPTMKERPAPSIPSKLDSMATSAAADGRAYMTAIGIRVANGQPALKPSIKPTKKLRPFDPATPLASSMTTSSSIRHQGTSSCIQVT